MTNPETLNDFADRTAFVTGGARGIGLGIVHALLRRGVKVAIADISADALARARDELVPGSGEVRFYQLDVTDRAQYADVAAEAVGDLGEVSLLFNNAGVIDSVSPSKLNYTMWDYVTNINLNGVYNGIQSFVPAMIPSGRRCHVVNTASEAGLLEAGSGFLYHASKYAVVGMSESLRRELEHFDIGVSVLLPGPVATDIVTNTRGLRPGEAPVHSERVTQILDSAHRFLNVAGASPEAVGELVLDGVESNAAYISTQAAFAEQLRSRTEAIVAAMRHAESFLADYHQESPS